MTSSQTLRVLSLALTLTLPAVSATAGTGIIHSPAGTVHSQAEAIHSPTSPIHSPAGTVHSPMGTATMEILPTGGDFHRIVADLRVVTSGGEEALLEGIVGTGYMISDVGLVVVIATDHPRHIPSRITLYNLEGQIVGEESRHALTDAALSSDGTRLACRTREGVLLLDLRTKDALMHRNIAPFAAGPNGLLAGADPDQPGRILFFENGRPVGEVQSDAPPRRLAFRANGSSLFILYNDTLIRCDLPSLDRTVIHRAATNEELWDLAVEGAYLRIVTREREGERLAGGQILLDSGGTILARETEAERILPRRSLSAAATRGTIPWPLEPNEQHPVGNTYGEYQNYGTPYLHPGHDIMGDPNQPVFAVADGVVKAVLTTSGEWHWRVATGEPGSGTSRGYLYAHIDEPTIAVSVGDVVVTGQYLGDLVPWPIYDFTHLHFAEIEDTGPQWFGDWLCSGNAHIYTENQTETEPPVFEQAIESGLFAFCDNQSSNYQDPNSLTGEVDIIVRVGDRIASDWLCTVQELRYTIYPVGLPEYPVVDDKLSVRFDMALDTYQGGPIDPFLVELLYKQDETCQTYGDYERREFYHIITNSSGDGVYEESDLWEAWDTTLLPDGEYIVRVTAYDVAGNATTDAMTVRTANGNPSSTEESDRFSAQLALQPNPAPGRAVISWSVPGSGPVGIDLYDPAGRRVRSLPLCGDAGVSGSILWDGRDDGGRLLPAGVYLVRMSDPGGVKAAKLQLLR